MTPGRHAALFRPPAGLANRHVQTLLPRMLPAPSPALTWETLALPDGDIVELSWVTPGPPDAKAPLFVLFHGLEGSVDSPYARQLLTAAAERGHRALLMHFRGCGRSPNRRPRAYHSGDTADAHWLLGELARRYPQAARLACGVSLGANMLLKLVAEDEARGDHTLKAAIAIAPPVDLAASADALERGFARVYQRHLLGALKAKVAPRLAAGELPLALSSRELAGLRTLRAYDDAVTAPLHGFDGAADYYRRASAGPLLSGIHRPTLILHAEDDPFMPPGLFDDLELGVGIRLEAARHGGHVGFIERRDGRLASWLARRVGDQLERWADTLPSERDAFSRSGS
ncbi:hydrolase [Halomonas getboli]|uniref:hydrolase n=1 Tax=Halomonas getboli TaxID=2935862 RepID=UPI001FFF99FC|nr:hydrolase [Halomonas getboli]MCK2183183.1 hydrolase [Halomonas getboli]